VRTVLARGMSLVEILIGLALGLVLVAGVGGLVAGSRQTSRAERNLLEMQATGRIATEVLAREIRKAGYRNNRELKLPVIFPVAAAPFVTAGAVVAGIAAGSEVSVRFQGSDNGATGLVDCLGNSIAQDETLWQTLSLVRGELRCRTRNLTTPSDQTLALVSQIEDLSITFGEDTDGDGYADAYRATAAVTDWSRVASVNVQLRVVSSEDGVADSPQAYLDFSGAAVTPNDRRLRRSYGTVVALRNLLP
jgi:hypothetical protein